MAAGKVHSSFLCVCFQPTKAEADEGQRLRNNFDVAIGQVVTISRTFTLLSRKLKFFFQVPQTLQNICDPFGRSLRGTLSLY